MAFFSRNTWRKPFQWVELVLIPLSWGHQLRFYVVCQRASNFFSADLYSVSPRACHWWQHSTRHIHTPSLSQWDPHFWVCGPRICTFFHYSRFASLCPNVNVCVMIHISTGSVWQYPLLCHTSYIWLKWQLQILKFPFNLPVSSSSFSWVSMPFICLMAIWI